MHKHKICFLCWGVLFCYHIQLPVLLHFLNQSLSILITTSDESITTNISESESGLLWPSLHRIKTRHLTYDSYLCKIWVFYFVTTSDFLSYFLSSTHTNHATLLILIIICNEIIMTNISESGSESGLILPIFHRLKQSN